ncbi:MAG: response regulator [Thermoleophilia bacterium]|nr:response regulator [Thermoleophilia bacterium]
MDCPPAGAPRTVILVVEANAIVRAMLRRALQRHGHRVLVAANAESAVALFEHADEPIGLVITEQRLSGMDGSHLADELRRRDPTVPILLVATTFDGPSSGYPQLEKPFTLEKLEQRIAEVLALPPRRYALRR